MRPRSPAEAHRAATPLELFYDLVFVVAIAQASSGLHHAIAAAHVADAILSYAMVFFAIWWAWMNFTWFASAYDNDDVAYRLVVFVQLAGALVLAAGVPRAFAARDFTVTTIGYAVMRAGLILQWLRAARSDVAHRRCALRYAEGVSVLQLAWIALLFVPSAWRLAGFGALVLAELAVPIWAERVAHTTWHPGHIAERYGLFTIIVLGEAVLATSTAIQTATDNGGLTLDLTILFAGGATIVFALWWFYFDWPMEDRLTSLRTAFIWGYGHYAVFAAAAAVGAGLGVAVEHATHHATIGRFGAGAAVAVPVAIYLLILWLLHVRPHADDMAQKLLVPGAVVLVLLTPLSGQAVPLTALLLALLLAIKLVRRVRPGQRTPRAG
jgi:low temperature requirement protein LtrA